MSAIDHVDNFPGTTAAERSANDIDATISELERRNELRTVLWRFMALAVFALSVAFEPDVLSHGIHVILVIAYGATSLVAVLLVLSRLFRPWMNWPYVVIDAALVVYLAAEHMFIPGASFVEALATPSLSIAFVLLSHASMRMRAGPVAAFAVLVVAGSTFAAIMSLSVPERPDVTVEEIRTAVVRLLAFAAVAAIQVTLVVDIRRLVRSAVSSRSERLNLAQFFSPGTAELLASEGRQVGLRRHDAAVLFVDLRGFTGLAERLPLEEVASLLADYRKRVSEAVAEADGTIDKYIGDGVMAVFGFPAPAPDDAARAYECAVDLTHRLEAWSEVRMTDGLEPLRFGIGIHYGQVIGGVIPGQLHSEYTVIGDAVNLAARLEGMCKPSGACIVMSDAVARRLPRNWKSGVWKFLSSATIAGRLEPVDIHVMTVPSPSGEACRG